jgi:hypothetical protein
MCLVVAQLNRPHADISLLNQSHAVNILNFTHKVLDTKLNRVNTKDMI